LDLFAQVGGDLFWRAFAVELDIGEVAHSGLFDGAGTVEMPSNAVSALAALEALREHFV
jgi:hypothetical protein